MHFYERDGRDIISSQRMQNKGIYAQFREVFKMQLKDNKLKPKKGYHLQDKNGNVFEGTIYLGCYDSKDNYTEITEEEYQEILKKLEEEYVEQISI